MFLIGVVLLLLGFRSASPKPLELPRPLTYLTNRVRLAYLIVASPIAFLVAGVRPSIRQWCYEGADWLLGFIVRRFPAILFLTLLIQSYLNS